MKKIKYMLISAKKKIAPHLAKIIKNISLFIKEFFYLRSEGKEPVFTPSATKTFLTLFRFMLLVMLCITVYPFWYKVSGKIADIRDSLTPAVMATYVSLDVVLAVLTGYLQNLYNRFKGEELEHLEKSKKSK